MAGNNSNPVIMNRLESNTVVQAHRNNNECKAYTQCYLLPKIRTLIVDKSKLQ